MFNNVRARHARDLLVPVFFKVWSSSQYYELAVVSDFGTSLAFHLFICQQFQHAVNSLSTFTLNIVFFLCDQLGVYFDYLLFETVFKVKFTSQM